MKILKLDLEVEQDGKRYRATGEIRRVKLGEWYLCSRSIKNYVLPGDYIIMEEILGGTT